MDMDKKKKFPVMAVILAVMAVLVVIGAVVIVLLLQKADSTQTGTQTGGIMTPQYEANVILDDPQTLQDLVNDMAKKAADGQMALEMKTEAYSEDGENFKCYLGNPATNSYEMYMVLFLDETEEEIYRSGLIPLGGRIENFTTVQKIEPGAHECTLVYNQVEDDGSTIHSQVNVGLNLTVNQSGGN